MNGKEVASGTNYQIRIFALFRSALIIPKTIEKGGQYV